LKFAVLLTCYNRKDKTQKCLENLFQQELPKGSDVQVFLSDDGSSDGTSEMVKTTFPSVHLIKGNGTLYWNGGMDLAWKSALEFDSFDFYIWLNDDTFLLPMAILKIHETFTRLIEPGIITAACRIPGTNDFSYGGWSGFEPIIPNGEIQEVILTSGNFVLIPSGVVDTIGTLSPKFTHYLGDYDYGLRAIEAGFNCYTTAEYLAECHTNPLPYWGNPKFDLPTRWKMLHDVKGQAFSEYTYFKFRHYGVMTGIKTVLDTYLKVVNPRGYVGLRKFFKAKLSF